MDSIDPRFYPHHPDSGGSLPNHHELERMLLGQAPWRGAGSDDASDGIVLAFIQVFAKIHVWQQYTTRVSLNGTTDDFWPTILTKKHAGLVKRHNAGRPGQNIVSTGLPSLAMYLAYSKNEKGGFAIDTPEKNFPRRIEGAPRVKDVNAEAWSFAPHAPTALVMTNLWDDPHWYPEPGKPTGRLTGELENAEAAAVRTVCDPSIREVDESTNSIALPILQDYHTWSPSNTKPENRAVIRLAETLRSQNKSSLLTKSGNMTTVFIQPGRNMTSVTTGLLILGPKSPSRGRFAVVCSVDARWNRALHTMAKSDDYGIGSIGNTIAARLRGRRTGADLKKSTLPINNGHWRHIAAEPAWLEAALGYATSFNFGYPPFSIHANGPTYQTTALGAILMARIGPWAKRETPIEYWSNNTAAIESVVSTAFADTISRVGMERQQIAGGHTPTESVRSCHQISNKYTFCPPPAASEMDQWTALDFKGFTTGSFRYAYKASKATDFIAIALLAIYVLIVTVYIATTARDHLTFMCWDTIEELILLARNSSPNNFRSSHNDAGANSAPNDSSSTEALMHHLQKDEGTGVLQEHQQDPLANTSSGIACLATMNLCMRIRVNHLPSVVGQDAIEKSKKDRRSLPPTGKIQMIFTDEEATRMQPVRPGNMYG
ncbi:MAG: hypothetical protein Q9224_005305 [Gallowayella concinna]